MSSSGFPDQVSIVMRHFPLAGHEHGFEAAIAAECAADQEVFDAYHSAIFAAPESLAFRAWSKYAQSAGARDMSAFVDCVANRRTAARVERDIAVGKRLGVVGTPTILVNDEQYFGNVKGLEKVIKAKLKGH